METGFLSVLLSVVHNIYQLCESVQPLVAPNKRAFSVWAQQFSCFRRAWRWKSRMAEDKSGAICGRSF